MRHQEDRQSTKATSSLFPIEMIAKLGRIQYNAQQNREQLQNLTMGVTINNESTTTEPPPKKGQQPKPLEGVLNAFDWYPIFALDSAVVEEQKMLILFIGDNINVNMGLTFKIIALAVSYYSALVIYVRKLPLGACSIRACSISKLRKWIRS